MILIIIIIILLIILLINKKSELFTINSKVIKYIPDYIIPINKKSELFTINSKVIYLSYKTKDIPDYIIPNIKKLYPNYEIKLYDNNDCIEFLKKEYSQEYVDIFNYLKDGPIKADFWRLCILYKYGGIYFDIDIEHFNNLDNIIENDTTFTTLVIDPTYRTKKRDFNPAIIITNSNNKIIKKCINIYLDKYKNKIKYNYWEYSIVTIMSKILYDELNQEVTKDGIYYDTNKDKYQFLLEKVPKGKNKNIYQFLLEKIPIFNKNIYIEYNNKKYCNSRYSNYNSYLHKFK
jgi:mannosyltransferase OCH1-like enzyme